MSRLTSHLHSVIPPDSFFSAASLELALACLGGGARGETLLELQEIFGWNTHGKDPFAPIAEFALRLNQLGKQREPVLAIANSVFTRVPIRAEYAAALAASPLRATIQPLTSAAAVNGFIDSCTKSRISSIVDDAALANVQLLVANAMYFKGTWETAFERRLTCSVPFLGSNTPCDLMQSPKQNWMYHRDEKAQYVLLPYRTETVAEAGRQLAALVTLPHDSATPIGRALSEALPAETVISQLRKGQTAKGIVWLPRFKIESTILLSEYLQALGLRRAFTTLADFSGVCDLPLCLSQVIQKAFVCVNEEGTEAAVATVVNCLFSGSSVAESIFEMRCDRPFGFSIVDIASQRVLLSGAVSNPRRSDEERPAKAASRLDFNPRIEPAPQPVTAPSRGVLPGSLEARQVDAMLFTGACRRDIYRVLCSLSARHTAGFHPRRKQFAPRVPLRWMYSVGTESFVAWPLDSGSQHEGVEQLKMLEKIGLPEPQALGITAAFEKLLVEEFVPYWEAADLVDFSIQFLVAFGNELTPRLDASHAVRSRSLSTADLAFLRSLPPDIHFDQHMVDLYHP